MHLLAAQAGNQVPAAGGFGQQPLREQQPACLLHLFRGCAEMLFELSAQRALAYSGFCRQFGE